MFVLVALEWQDLRKRTTWHDSHRLQFHLKIHTVYALIQALGSTSFLNCDTWLQNMTSTRTSVDLCNTVLAAGHMRARSAARALLYVHIYTQYCTSLGEFPPL